MDKPWKIILLLAGIFATGATTGGLVAVRVCKEKLAKLRQPPPIEQWAPERLRKLKERLSLSPEQVEKVKPIMRRDMAELGTVRGGFIAESVKIIERMERDIAAELTPEQKQEYEKMKQERLERWQRLTRERERGGKSRGERKPDAEGKPDGARPPPSDGTPGERVDPKSPPPGGV